MLDHCMRTASGPSRRFQLADSSLPKLTVAAFLCELLADIYNKETARSAHIQ